MWLQAVDPGAIEIDELLDLLAVGMDLMGDRKLITDARANIREAYDILDQLNEGYVLVSKAAWDRARLREQLIEASGVIEQLEARLKKRARTVPAQLRAAVAKRDRGQCRYCGAEINGVGQMDHYNPDGPTVLANLVLACAPCNLQKRNIPPESLGLLGMQLLPEPADEPTDF